MYTNEKSRQFDSKMKEEEIAECKQAVGGEQ